MNNVLACFKCGCDLDYAGGERVAPERRNQPSGGLYFRTFGNYGSTFFDPFRDSAFLEIAVCDECMRWAKEQGRRILPSESVRDLEWD